MVEELRLSFLVEEGVRWTLEGFGGGRMEQCEVLDRFNLTQKTRTPHICVCVCDPRANTKLDPSQKQAQRTTSPKILLMISTLTAGINICTHTLYKRQETNTLRRVGGTSS